MKDVFLWVILPLVLAEVVLIGPWLAERLLRWAGRGLPEDYRERYVDDWLGELDAVPGSLTKLAFAIRVVVRVPATERALSGRDALWILVVRRVLALLIRGLLSVVRLLIGVKGDRSRILVVDSLDPTFEDKQVPAGNTPLDRTSMHPRTIQAFRSIGVSTTDQLVTWYFENHLMQGEYGEIQPVPDEDWDEAIRVVLSDVLIYGD